MDLERYEIALSAREVVANVGQVEEVAGKAVGCEGMENEGSESKTEK